MSALSTTVTPAPLDVERIRRDFPILSTQVHGKPLVYLDNGASSQRPTAVLDAERYYAEHLHANVHRGVHQLSQWATDAFEGARETVRRFINAASTREVIFVRGTTEAINLVAQSWGRPRLGPGDEIIVSRLEHHANSVPWQMVCEQTGARLVVAPINQRGELELDALPGEIEALEQEQAALRAELADGTLYARDGQRAVALHQRDTEIEERLMAALERWEALSARA